MRSPAQATFLIEQSVSVLPEQLATAPHISAAESLGASLPSNPDATQLLTPAQFAEHLTRTDAALMERCNASLGGSLAASPPSGCGVNDAGETSPGRGVESGGEDGGEWLNEAEQQQREWIAEQHAAEQQQREWLSSGGWHRAVANTPPTGHGDFAEAGGGGGGGGAVRNGRQACAQGLATPHPRGSQHRAAAGSAAGGSAACGTRDVAWSGFKRGGVTHGGLLSSSTTSDLRDRDLRPPWNNSTSPKLVVPRPTLPRNGSMLGPPVSDIELRFAAPVEVLSGAAAIVVPARSGEGGGARGGGGGGMASSVGPLAPPPAICAPAAWAG